MGVGEAFWVGEGDGTLVATAGGREVAVDWMALGEMSMVGAAASRVGVGASLCRLLFHNKKTVTTRTRLAMKPAQPKTATMGEETSRSSRGDGFMSTTPIGSGVGPLAGERLWVGAIQANAID